MSPRYYRRVIRIRAQDSPNVRHAETCKAVGKSVTTEGDLPGVLSYAEYRRRRATWDKVRQCVGLDAEFYEGAEVLMYPPDWLNRAEHAADALRTTTRRAEAMGIDPAEGGDSSCWYVIDRYGIVHWESRKTPNTAFIPSHTLELMRRFNVPAERVAFDRGGGGKQHADALRAKGVNVRTVAFGESIADDPRRGLLSVEHRRDTKETRYEYRNRRAQMYGELRELLDPSHTQPDGRPAPAFGIPAACVDLRAQLAPIPLWYDDESRLYLPPKNRRPDAGEGAHKVTLTELIGRSPDDADALVLAVHAMLHKHRSAMAGPVGR